MNAVREHRLNLRLNEREWQMINRAAAAGQISPTEWVRSTAVQLARAEQSLETQQLLADVGRLAERVRGLQMPQTVMLEDMMRPIQRMFAEVARHLNEAMGAGAATAEPHEQLHAANKKAKE